MLLAVPLYSGCRMGAGELTRAVGLPWGILFLVWVVYVLVPLVFVWIWKFAWSDCRDNCCGRSWCTPVAS